MATRRKEPANVTSANGRIRFRYTDTERTLDFTMENVTGDSVTEGLRSLANALAGQPIVPERRRVSKGAIDVAPIQQDEEDLTTESDRPGSENVEATDSEEPSATNATPKAKRPRKPKAPKLLSNLKLTDSSLPLSDFMKQKNPPDMMDKYAAVAVWLKEQFQITEVSIDHIFTAFKHLGIDSQLPTDIAKPLNNLTYNRKWFDKGKSPGTYTINWVGESEVGKMGSGGGK